VKKTDNTNPDSILYGERDNTEQETKEGKQNPDVTMTATVRTDTNNHTAMVYNKKLGILPATGGSGILFYLFVGGGIAAIALVLMRKTKKAATAA
jgi:LPXTG-motif cell wall-anchored protein